MKKIGVGIIGASPARGWAVWAHIPALRALPQYEIRAVSTSRRESAEAAQRAFQVDAYDNPQDLIRHSGVDLVVVCVKVPNHYPLVLAALDAGKMVYCEWPLGVNTTQALEMESRAKQTGMRTVVGLQGRFSPQIQQARRLIEDGYVGEVLSTTLVSSGTAWGGSTSRSNSYLFDEHNGATVLTVPALHAIDTLAFVSGEFESIQARSALRTPFVEVLEDHARIAVTAPDQVSVTGRLKSGALASVFVRGGVSRAGNLYWQINGSDGDLAFSSDSGNIQVADLRLHGGRGAAKEVQEIAVPDELGERIPALASGFASNIARLYVQFASDLEHNTRVAPDFSYAVARHGLLDRIRLASNDPGVGAAAAGGASK
jgi:predicted dehydrogenase